MARIPYFNLCGTLETAISFGFSIALKNGRGEQPPIVSLQVVFQLLIVF